MSSSVAVDTDYLIVGGGSAGCVLASRLSEDPRNRVLLVEAGLDAAKAEDYPDLASSYPGLAFANARYTWPRLRASRGWTGSNAAVSADIYEQARVIGGGSAINGLGANRGAPSDYDEWAEMGLHGWSWDDCLPYFRKLEHDCDIDDTLHGKDGPLPVRRRADQISTSFTDAMVAVCRARGIQFLPDQNGIWQDGVFEMALNVGPDGRRVSAAWGWLTDEVRQRPNLEIRTETVVQEVLFDANRVTGVRVTRNGQETVLHAARVILAAGALASPALLMRAGIGPAGHLNMCGITVRHHLPGVGQNLMEHPSAGLIPYLRPSARQKGPLDYHIPFGYRFSSGLEGAPRGDMHMNFVTRAAWHPVGQRLGSLFFWVNKSYSRGQLALDPADPMGPPVIDFRLLSDHRDLVRLADAFEHAVALAIDPSLKDVIDGLYAGGISQVGKLFTLPSTAGRLVTALGGLGLDLIGRLREKVFPLMLANYDDPVRLVADREALEAYVRRVVGGVWHPSGTCRMGPDGDPLAVTDAMGRVRGVDGLYVCDASIMPTIPCANINVPVLMMAEKISDGLRAGR